MRKIDKKCIDYRKLWDGLKMFFVRVKKLRSNRELLDEMRVRELRAAREVDKIWRKGDNNANNNQAVQEVDTTDSISAVEGN